MLVQVRDELVVGSLALAEVNDVVDVDAEVRCDAVACA